MVRRILVRLRSRLVQSNAARASGVRRRAGAPGRRLSAHRWPWHGTPWTRRSWRGGCAMRVSPTATSNKPGTRRKPTLAPCTSSRRPRCGWRGTGRATRLAGGESTPADRSAAAVGARPRDGRLRYPPRLAWRDLARVLDWLRLPARKSKPPSTTPLACCQRSLGSRRSCGSSRNGRQGAGLGAATPDGEPSTPKRRRRRSSRGLAQHRATASGPYPQRPASRGACIAPREGCTIPALAEAVTAC